MGLFFILLPLPFIFAWFVFYKRFGARPWVRVYLFGIILFLFAPMIKQHGLAGAIFFAALFTFLLILLVARKLASVRVPLESNMQAVAEIPWPDYARERAGRFASEVRDSGLFLEIVNGTSHTRVGKRTITQFMMMAMNRERNAYIHLSINDNGEKRFAYVVRSVAQDGKDLVTSNRILNGNLFSDPLFVSARIPESESIAPYMERHLELCRKYGPLHTFDEDVLTTSKKLSRAWNDRMMDAGNLELASDGTELKITSQALLRVTLHALKGLFV